MDRYLLDTNIFVFLATEVDQLEKGILEMLNEPDAQLYMSAESVRELIVAYRNKGLMTKRWKTEEDMVRAIEDEFNIRILPLGKEHMLTYSRLTLNEAQGHKGPSDHVIIAHALTERLTLISSDRRFAFYRGQGLDLIWNER